MYSIAIVALRPKGSPDAAMAPATNSVTVMRFGPPIPSAGTHADGLAGVQVLDPAEHRRRLVGTRLRGVRVRVRTQVEGGDDEQPAEEHREPVLEPLVLVSVGHRCDAECECEQQHERLGDRKAPA